MEGDVLIFSCIKERSMSDMLESSSMFSVSFRFILGHTRAYAHFFMRYARIIIIL